MPEFYFDIDQQELMDGNGSVIKLRPQSISVLALLLANPNQIVSRELISNAVWPGRHVTDDSITQCIADIRRALGEKNRNVLQTIPKTGYRLKNLQTAHNGKVIEQHSGITAESENTSTLTLDHLRIKRPSRPTSVLLVSLSLVITGILLYQVKANWPNTQSHAPDYHGPALAVLPLRSSGGKTDAHYFAEGVTEDIILALTKFSGLRVMSWDSMADYTAGDTGIDQLADEFNLHSVVTGSVRRINERVRVSVRLLEVSSGRVLWSNQFDKQLEDIFEVQDHISREVASALSLKLQEIYEQRAAVKPTDKLQAYDYLLRGRKQRRQRTRSDNFASRASFENAIEIDPKYGAVYREYAMAYIDELQLGWTEWPELAENKSLELLKTAIALDANDAQSYGILGWLYLYSKKYNLSKKAIDKALELNPHHPLIHANLGFLQLWTGKPELAVSSLEVAHRFDPTNPYVLNNLGAAYAILGRIGDAIFTLEQGLEIQPESSDFANIFLTVAHIENGDESSASKAVERLLERNPFFRIAHLDNLDLLHQQSDSNRFYKALMKAGLQ